MRGSRIRTSVVAALWLATLALPGLVHGQAITGLSATKNGSNSADANDNITIANLDTGFHRASTAGILTSSPTAFTTQYAWANAADSDLANTDVTSTLTSNYTVAFTVTAPGAYDLIVDTERNGHFHTVDDSGNGNATASATAVAASFSGGVLSGGALTIPAPANTTGGNANAGFAGSNSATISGTSNGAPVAHSLTFSWTSTCFSNSTNFFFGGDACGIRAGLPVTNTTLSVTPAATYPGAPVRTQTADGHIVDVTLISYCGNGIIDAGKGETCDEGGNNGAADSCCNADCTLKSIGTECRGLAGDCDVAEQCDGANGACPADAFVPAATLCRAASSAEVCDVDDFCDGLGPNCADDVEPPTTVCRAASPGAVCDITEFCDGTNKVCPTDAVEPPSTVCRAAASVGEECDIDEFCDGSGYFCPPDAVEPSSTVCRNAAGVCDVAETCDGSNKACPADAVEAPTTVCRAASPGQECDAVELCDGVGVDCPADGVELAGTTCRNAAGVCDLSETCDGVGSDCPADGPKSTAVCRAAAGACDVAESCDGVNDDCPSDAFVPDTTPCDDSNFCNGVQVCTAGVCGGGSSPCMVGESCDEGADICYLGCPPSPTACLVAGKSKVLIKNNTSDNTKDKVIFKWLKGPATVLADFADPTASADYSLCFYDDSGLLQSADVPSGSNWAPISTKGYKYKDNTGAADGITKVILKSGGGGKSKALVKGKGMNLPDFDSDLPVGMTDLPLIVQLRNNSNGKCFEGVFAAPKKDLTTQFNAKTP